MLANGTSWNVIFANVSSTERTSDKQRAAKAHRVDLDASDNRSSDDENGKAY